MTIPNIGAEWHVHRNKREIVDDRGFYVAYATDEATAAQVVADHKRVVELEAALKALDDYYQASGKVWDDARRS